mgnify:CR=1 FL=1
MRNGSARRVAVSGLLTSLMLVLGLIERQFPLTAAIPGIKLGLANSVLIYALYMLGVKQSIVLMLLKAMMSWLIYTNMQAMFYSLAGGVLSLLAMIALSPTARTGTTNRKIQAIFPPMTKAMTKANTSISGARMAVRISIM